jgi:DNA polymerase-4
MPAVRPLSIGDSMGRVILHVDLDAFFCSVEELHHPELAGKPFIVGARPEQRGVVASASYPARVFGVHSAMPTARALRLCPSLIVVHPRHAAYSESSDRVMALLREAAPIVEQVSVDEAFLDVSDDPRGGLELAAVLQARIRSELHLPTSWGVATSRLVAKIATEVGKPNGLVVVPPGEERAFLAPLPVGMLWGVGPKTRARLEELEVRTIGDLAALQPERLCQALGEHGLELASRAVGKDDQPVVDSNEPKSMSSETTFSRDVQNGRELRRTLLRLAEEVGRRLREGGVAGSTVRLKLRWSDFTSLTRQVKVAQPVNQDGEVYRAVLSLFDATWPKGKPVRLIGVGVSGLGSQHRQLSLFDRAWEQDGRLMQAVDAIRARFGQQALQRAADLRSRRAGPPREGEES